jgi:hypothetical protein
MQSRLGTCVPQAADTPSGSCPAAGEEATLLSSLLPLSLQLPLPPWLLSPAAPALPLLRSMLLPLPPMRPWFAARTPT